jgi:GH35 family endo-1,4-beta-xylanase
MNPIARTALLMTGLLAMGASAEVADKPASLKDTFKDDFLVGTAVNRSMVTAGAGFRRSAEQSAKNAALVKEQFNQISPENDLKWQSIHPRAGADGYEFGADIAKNAATTQGGLVSDADKKLADTYVGIFRAFLKHHDSVKVVTFWGANDANSWRAQGKPLLFDGNSQPKLAFEAVIRDRQRRAIQINPVMR